jgi:YgiT-type zinc finger domain-containing protein
MDKCPLCKGEKKPGNVIYTVNIGTGIIIVKDVPASVCNQCGEEWINSKIAKELEKIIESARKQKLQLEIIPFINKQQKSVLAESRVLSRT